MSDSPDTPKTPAAPAPPKPAAADLPLQSPLAVAKALAAGASTQMISEEAEAQLPHDQTMADMPPEPVVAQTPTRSDADRSTNVGQQDEGALQARILKRMDDHQSGPYVDPLLGAEVGGRFDIVEKIGEGGMGAVYRARQKNMDRDVAIKVLLGQVADNPTIVRRFHLEALAVSKLKSPHTIQIFDFGETESKQLYIAMEYLDGTSLHDLLKRDRVLPVRRALRIIEQMSRSLREAHNKGIIHRDLKPDNVFLITIGEDPDFVKVLDFGVAKLREGDPDGGTVTKTGTIFGTPKYMSPEQAKGAAIDVRSDLYALGVMLYEMVCGQAPFNAESSLGVLIKHIQEQPPLIEELRPDLMFPDELLKLLDRLLSKRPEERPQTAEALIREIGKILDGLDDIYRNVVTTEEAARIGLEIATTPRTRQNTRLNESAPEMVPTLGGVRAETLTFPDQPGADKRWRLALAALVFLLLVTVGGAGGVYASLERLPEDYRGLAPIAVASVDSVPEVAAEVITVSVNVLPADAAVEVWRGDEKLEFGSSFMLKKPKGAAPQKLTFKADKFKEQTRTFEFDKDANLLVQLASVEPPKPKVVERAEPERSNDRPRTQPKSSGKVASTGTAKVDPPKAEEPKKKFEFDFGKVKDTKKSPGGTKGSTTKSSPY